MPVGFWIDVLLSGSHVLSKFWCESGLLVLRLVRKMGRCCCLVSPVARCTSSFEFLCLAAIASFSCSAVQGNYTQAKAPKPETTTALQITTPRLIHSNLLSSFSQGWGCLCQVVLRHIRHVKRSKAQRCFLRTPTPLASGASLEIVSTKDVVLRSLMWVNPESSMKGTLSSPH